MALDPNPALHQYTRRQNRSLLLPSCSSMPVAVQRAVEAGGSLTHILTGPTRTPYLPPRPLFVPSLPGTFTITEEEADSSDSPSFVGFSRHTLQSMLRPQAAFAANASARRHSNISHGSSTRSHSDEATPTVAMLAHDREVNMRTPRPHTATASTATPTAANRQLNAHLLSDAFPDNTLQPDAGDSSDARVMQWQQRRDASDTTIDARDAPNGPGGGSNMYASDSLGRMSTASSHLAASGSEFGNSLRGLAASDSGHERTLQRKSRKVAPPEVLVVVRPPPSKQGNPLNLQIQLVTPQQGSSGGGGSAAARASSDLSRDDLPASATNASMNSTTGSNMALGSGLRMPPSTGSGLRRSNSVGSSRSALSEASTTFSAGSASSSGRRVTPLYNLCFHSFLPTTVTDAGTDQKVAKFGKRGVEIDGFGQLTPHELAMGVNDLASMDRRRRSFVVSNAAVGRPGSASGGSDLASHGGRSEGSIARSTEATTVHTNANSDAASGTRVSGASGRASSDVSKYRQEPPTSFDAMSPQAKDPSRDPIGGGLGGKLLRSFKRFSVNTAAIVPAAASSTSVASKSIISGRTGDAAESFNASGGVSATSIIARVRGAATKVKEGSESLAAGSGNGATHDDDDSMSVAESARNGGNNGDTDVPQLAVGAGLRSDGSRRAQGYYWIVRKWSRRLGEHVEEDINNLVPGRLSPGTNPILNSVWKRFNVVNRMGGTEVHPPSSQIPVRFEWTRTESRKKSFATTGSVGRHGRAATDVGGGGRSVRSQSSVRGSMDARSTGHETMTAAAAANTEESAKRSTEALRPPTNGGSGSRPSSLFHAGSSGAERGSIDRTSAVSAGDDDETSDPEDSETKWACHLVLGPTTRIPIGSLAPTPHHPKLVAQLTVPYPLPDLSQSGLGVDGAGLTREELKDIISVTALFVIVREAFGGLAKRRKGDSALKFGAAVVQR